VIFSVSMFGQVPFTAIIMPKKNLCDQTRIFLDYFWQILLVSFA